MAAVVLVDILAAGDAIVKTIDPPTATANLKIYFLEWNPMYLGSSESFRRKIEFMI